ncbi:MAG: alkaline phosphatase family protein [Opitutae bacterium]|nr:alkaline phosphatase family protein [Opitutae bacterium]
MGRTAVLNIVGLTPGLVGAHTPSILRFSEQTSITPVRPVLPAVTCTAQSTYLTGKSPSLHGIVANGWFDRKLSEHHFWKQSNHLVEGEKIWETLRKKNPDYTCAKMFWWFNMYSSADWSVTPRPMYPTDGRKIFDVYTHPLSMRDNIKNDLGDFPFHSFWGPAAGIKSSQWIAESAKWIEDKQSPDLNLVYLPHLDYNLQRLGPSDYSIEKDLIEIDKVVGDLIEYYSTRGVQVLLLSEYGITDVNNPIFPNRKFREKGWIEIKDEIGLELLDCGASKAFAITDHQVSHIYINDKSIKGDVRHVLESLDGVSKIYDKDNRSEVGLDHSRSGDLVAFSDEKSWFSYYHWFDDSKAPDFARCVDVHRKYGYDPVELFLDPSQPLIKGRIALNLLKKKLGLRMLMDVIPLDAGLVKGSHGSLPANRDDWAVLIGDIDTESDFIEATDVHAYLLQACG